MIRGSGRLFGIKYASVCFRQPGQKRQASCSMTLIPRIPNPSIDYYPILELSELAIGQTKLATWMQHYPLAIETCLVKGFHAEKSSCYRLPKVINEFATISGNFQP